LEKHFSLSTSNYFEPVRGRVLVT